MKYIVPPTILFFLFTLLLPYSYVFSQTETSINANVKMSLCGDFIIEDPEDCEIGIPITDSCKTLGYSSGSLICDVSCSYDTTNCVPYTPIPPKPTPLPPTRPIFITPIPPNDLPKIFWDYDLDSDYKISMNELFVAIRSWVGVWRQDTKQQSCDYNSDGLCNLVDLSILLYYSND